MPHDNLGFALNRPEFAPFKADPDEDAYVTFFGIQARQRSDLSWVDAQVILYTHSTDASDGLGAGPELSELWERKGFVRWLATSGGSTLTRARYASPDAPGNVTSDDDEPYIWFPANSQDIIDFVSQLADNQRVGGTFYIGMPDLAAPAFVDPTGAPILGIRGTPLADVVVPEAVRVAGNEQVIDLESGWASTLSDRYRWAIPAADRPASTTRSGGSLVLVDVTDAGVLRIDATGNSFLLQVRELGSVELSAAGRTIAVNLRGMDVLDPYNFTPDDVSDGTDFFNEVSGGQHAGVLKIRDYEPGSEALPEPEYAAVGGLPAGVSFDPATRALSFDHEAIERGSGTIRIRATNSEGHADWTADYEFRESRLFLGDTRIDRAYLGGDQLDAARIGDTPLV